MGVLSSFLSVKEQYPELPVIPMVSAHVVTGPYPLYWMGKIGQVRIREYLFVADALHFREGNSPAAMEGVLEELQGPDALKGTEQEIAGRYQALPWERAIFLYIEPPDGER